MKKKAESEELREIKNRLVTRFDFYGFDFCSEVDSCLAAKLLRCEHEIIMRALKTWRLPGRNVLGTFLIHIEDLFYFGVQLEKEKRRKEGK